MLFYRNKSIRIDFAEPADTYGKSDVSGQSDLYEKL